MDKKLAIVMGSNSDWPTMCHTATTLDKFAVNYDSLIISAHRTPERLHQFARTAADQYDLIIAGAGGSAHLPGMLAAECSLPVLGVPITSKAMQGMDSLLSIVQMPQGIPVACLAIGVSGAVNAALLAVAIQARTNPQLRQALLDYRRQQSAAVPEVPQ